MKNLIEKHYPHIEYRRLVQDNLNTHTPGSFYEVLPPDEAFALAQQFELHYTPEERIVVKHGRERVRCAFDSVSGPTACRGGHLASGSAGLGHQAQSRVQNGQLAIFTNRCAH